MKQLSVVLLLLMLFSFLGYTQPPVGSLAPEISLPNAQNEMLRLSSLKGKVVLLDFWASWCAPCRQSNRSLNSLYKRFKDKGLEFFAVSIDGNRNAWENAVRQDKMQWIQVIDQQAERGNQLTRTWNLQYIPSNFLIDRDGRIVAEGLRKDDLENWLKRLL